MMERITRGTGEQQHTKFGRDLFLVVSDSHAGCFSCMAFPLLGCRDVSTIAGIAGWLAKLISLVSMYCKREKVASN